GFRFGMPEYPADGTEGTKFYEADTLAYAVGMRPRWAAADALRDSAPEFYHVGDCVMPTNNWQAPTRDTTLRETSEGCKYAPAPERAGIFV
ncbi:MAG: hypothetical protein IJH73_00095, partial [Lachnospiraceae bacterium]|nr:hypothetical protein [Lachnospiraceae bacterium]